LVTGNAEYRERNQILDDEDADGNATVEGSQLALGFKDLGGENGARECQSGREQQAIPRPISRK